jgi:hypothetical protein
MACRTPSVERVADSTAKAKEQIDKLQVMIEAQEAANKAKFYQQIDDHLASAQLTDARELAYQVNIKTEYTSEFSLDKIAEGVTSALKAAKVATDPKNPMASTSPEAIDAYTDVVNAIAEAAKSSSTAAASIAFSMNRLAPGTIAFLYASSFNIQDDETFGKEAVTTTAIYYRLIQSELDIELEGAFNATRIRVAADLETYRRFIILQAGLVDRLSAETISFETYLNLDEAYSKKAVELQKRVKDGGVQKVSTLKRAALIPQEAKKLSGLSKENHELVLTAIEKLSTMGDSYKAVIEKTQSRIAAGYF